MALWCRIFTLKHLKDWAHAVTSQWCQKSNILIFLWPIWDGWMGSISICPQDAYLIFFLLILQLQCTLRYCGTFTLAQHVQSMSRSAVPAAVRLSTKGDTHSSSCRSEKRDDCQLLRWPPTSVGKGGEGRRRVFCCRTTYSFTAWMNIAYKGLRSTSAAAQEEMTL